MDDSSIRGQKPYIHQDHPKPQKGPLLLKKEGSHSYAQIIKLDSNQNLTAQKVTLVKAWSFSGLKFLFKSFREGMKVERVDAKNVEEKKSSKYFLRINDICSVCGIKTIENFKQIEKTGLDEYISSQNLINIGNKVTGIFKGVDFREFTKEFAHELNNKRKLGDEDKVIDLVNNFTNLKKNGIVNITKNQFSQLLNQLTAPVDLKEIKKEHQLNDEQYSKLQYLSSIVPVGNLAVLLKEAKKTNNDIKILNTFYKVANELIEKGFPKSETFVQQTADSFKFSLDKYGAVHLYINNLKKDAINLNILNPRVVDNFFVLARALPKETPKVETPPPKVKIAPKAEVSPSKKEEVKPQNIMEDRLVLDKIKQEYNLDEQQIKKLKYLSTHVPLKNIVSILNDAKKYNEEDKFLNTFYKAADELMKNGFPKTKLIYFKKTSDSFSFALTHIDKHFIIAMDKLAEGGMKKVNDAIDVTSNKKLVKVVVRDDKERDYHVSDMQREESLQEMLYNSNNPYIIRPTKVTLLTKTSLKDSKTKKAQLEYSKYINFQDQMVGNGLTILSTETDKIAQFLHDYVKGLELLHKIGYVHGDVKPANSLLVGNRTKMIDFGITLKEGEDVFGASSKYMAPENLEFDKKTKKASRSNDIFSVGVMMLHMLDRGIMIRIGSYAKSAALLSDADKEKLFKSLISEANSNRSQLSKEDVNKRIKLIELAKKLMVFDPKKRPTADQVAKEISLIFPGVITEDPTKR